MAKKSFKQQYEELKAEITAYATAVRNRRAVVHSTTPATIVRADIKGPSSIQIAELITIVKTANALKKHVCLEADDKTLTVNLVDQYPALPYVW